MEAAGFGCRGPGQESWTFPSVEAGLLFASPCRNALFPWAIFVGRIPVVLTVVNPQTFVEMFGLCQLSGLLRPWWTQEHLQHNFRTGRAGKPEALSPRCQDAGHKLPWHVGGGLACLAVGRSKQHCECMAADHENSQPCPVLNLLHSLNTLSETDLESEMSELEKWLVVRHCNFAAMLSWFHSPGLKTVQDWRLRKIASIAFLKQVAD